MIGWLFSAQVLGLSVGGGSDEELNKQTWVTTAEPKKEQLGVIHPSIIQTAYPSGRGQFCVIAALILFLVWD